MGNAGGLAGVQLNQDPVPAGALPNVTGVNPLGASDSAAQQYQAGLQSALTALEQRAASPNWGAVAAGFASAPAGSCFFRELGGANQALGQWQEQRRQMQIPIANLKIQMAINRLAQDKTQQEQAVMSNPGVQALIQNNPAAAGAINAHNQIYNMGFPSATETQNAAQTGATTAQNLINSRAQQVTAMGQLLKQGVISQAQFDQITSGLDGGNAPVPVLAGKSPMSGTNPYQAPLGDVSGAAPSSATTAPVQPGTTGSSATPNNGAIPLGAAVHAMTIMEGGGVLNPPANPASSARGSGQLTAQTLSHVAQEANINPALYGKCASATDAINTKLFTDNGQFLQSHGVPNSLLSNRVAWYLGAPAAVKAAHSDPNTPLADIVGQAAVAANKWPTGMTVGEFVAGQEALLKQKTGLDPTAPVALSGSAPGVTAPMGAIPPATNGNAQTPVAGTPASAAVIPTGNNIPQLLLSPTDMQTINTGSAKALDALGREKLSELQAAGSPDAYTQHVNAIDRMMSYIQANPQAANAVSNLMAKLPGGVAGSLAYALNSGANIGIGNLAGHVGMSLPPILEGALSPQDKQYLSGLQSLASQVSLAQQATRGVNPNSVRTGELSLYRHAAANPETQGAAMMLYNLQYSKLQAEMMHDMYSASQGVLNGTNPQYRIAPNSPHRNYDAVSNVVLNPIIQKYQNKFNQLNAAFAKTIGAK